jgi:hypothetical protein
MAAKNARRGPATHLRVRNSDTVATVNTPRCKMQLAVTGENRLCTAAPGRIHARRLP